MEQRAGALGWVAAGGRYWDNGVGDASSYLWDAEATATFALGRRVLLSTGYRAFHYDRTDGEGADEVSQNVTVSGLILGVAVGLF